jgi:hypothetical protein
MNKEKLKMAKKRMNIGSIVKSKDPTKSNYLQIRKDLKEPIVLTAGQYLQVESKAFQLASIERAAAAGKLSGEALQGAKERANKIPDFVLGEVVLVSDV